MTLFARQYPSEAEAERAYRRRWILIPGVVVLLCVVVGMVYALGPWRTREATVSQAYAPGISRIELDNPRDVLVTGADVDGVQASWQTYWNYRKPAVRSTQDGDTLKLRLDCSYSVGVECSADVRLIVPKGVALDVNSGGGDVDVAGIDGPVTVHGTGGNVHLSDVAGAADVRENSGDVRLTGMGGNVSAQTNSGDVLADGLYGKTARLSSNSGDVRGHFSVAPTNVIAESNSGDVKVGVPPGSGPYRVRADARSGDSRTDVTTSASATSTIDATAMSGDVRIFYADDHDHHRHGNDNGDDHRNGAPPIPHAPRVPAVPRVPDPPN